MGRQSKTFLMQLIETRHPGQKIEDILLKALREQGSERAAAGSLGITQQAFNAWKYRLGLEDQVLAILDARRLAKPNLQ